MGPNVASWQKDGHINNDSQLMNTLAATGPGAAHCATPDTLGPVTAARTLARRPFLP